MTPPTRIPFSSPPVLLSLDLGAGQSAFLAIPIQSKAHGGRLFVSRLEVPAEVCSHCTQPIAPDLPMVRLVGATIRSDLVGAPLTGNVQLYPAFPKVDDSGLPGVPIGILRDLGIAIPDMGLMPGQVLTVEIKVCTDPRLMASWGSPPYGTEEEKTWAINAAALAARLTGLELRGVLVTREA